MISLPISKDITTFEPKIVFGLTARTLAFTAAALSVGLGLGLLMALGLGVDPTEYPQVLVIMLGTVGLWAMGYLRPLGMLPEVWASLWIRQHLMPQRLTYKSSAALGRGPVPLAGCAKETHVRKKQAQQQTIDESYAKLRARRGIELWEPGAPSR